MQEGGEISLFEEESFSLKTWQDNSSDMIYKYIFKVKSLIFLSTWLVKKLHKYV